MPQEVFKRIHDPFIASKTIFYVCPGARDRMTSLVCSKMISTTELDSIKNK